MTRLLLLLTLVLPGAAVADHHEEPAQALTVTPSDAHGWVSLFNGKDLTGWKAAENPDTFRVEEGLIVAHGDRAHLFYTGDVNGGVFKDFELWVEVKTEPSANSGVYFHTAWQDEGWPMKGYEVQVNQTHKDFRKTGGLYGIVDVKDVSPVEDGQWYVEHIVVRGKRIVVRVDGEVTVDYTEPDHVEREGRFAERLIGEGTFAPAGTRSGQPGAVPPDLGQTARLTVSRGQRFSH